MIGFVLLQFEQTVEKMLADGARVLDQILLLDDLKEMRRAHHVGKIAAPG